MRSGVYGRTLSVASVITPCPTRSDDFHHANSHSQYSPNLGNVLTALQTFGDSRVQRVLENIPDAVQTVPHPVMSAHGRDQHIPERLNFISQALNVFFATLDVRKILLQSLEQLGDFVQIDFWCTLLVGIGGV